MSEDFVEKMVDKVMLVVRTSIEALRDNDSEMVERLPRQRRTSIAFTLNIWTNCLRLLQAPSV